MCDPSSSSPRKKKLAPAGNSSPSSAALPVTSRASGWMQSTHKKNPPAGLVNFTYSEQCC